MQSGNPIKLHCKITGRPTPNITWNKMAVELDINHIEIRTSNWDTSLSIDECNRDDTGNAKFSTLRNMLLS